MGGVSGQALPAEHRSTRGAPGGKGAAPRPPAFPRLLDTEEQSDSSWWQGVEGQG